MRSGALSLCISSILWLEFACAFPLIFTGCSNCPNADPVHRTSREHVIGRALSDAFVHIYLDTGAIPLTVDDVESALRLDERCREFPELRDLVVGRNGVGFCVGTSQYFPKGPPFSFVILDSLREMTIRVVAVTGRGCRTDVLCSTSDLPYLYRRDPSREICLNERAREQHRPVDRMTGEVK